MKHKQKQQELTKRTKANKQINNKYKKIRFLETKANKNRQSKQKQTKANKKKAIRNTKAQQLLL